MQYDASILVTTYNRSEKLKRCLESIIVQKNCNLEIIVIDDASSDGTKQLMNDFIKNHPNIKYHRKSNNTGLAKSRNIGLRLSTTSKVAFVDDDDYFIVEDKMSSQLAKFRPNSIVCGPVKTNTKILTLEFPTDFRHKIIYRNGMIHTSTTLIDKDAIFAVGGFDEYLTKGVDSDLYRRLIHFNYTDVIHLPKVMVAYDDLGDDRITNNTSIKKRVRRFKEALHLLWKYKNLSIKYPTPYAKRVIKALVLEPFTL